MKGKELDDWMISHGFAAAFEAMARNVVGHQHYYLPFASIPDTGEAIVKIKWDGSGDIRLLPMPQPEPEPTTEETVEQPELVSTPLEEPEPEEEIVAPKRKRRSRK